MDGMKNPKFKLGDTIEIRVPTEYIKRQDKLDWDWRRLSVTVPLTLSDEEMVSMANCQDFDGLHLRWLYSPNQLP